MDLDMREEETNEARIVENNQTTYRIRRWRDLQVTGFVRIVVGRRVVEVGDHDEIGLMRVIGARMRKLRLRRAATGLRYCDGHGSRDWKRSR